MNERIWWDAEAWKPVSAYAKPQQGVKRKKRTVPLVKEVYTVAVDYIEGDDGIESIVGLALIDRQILVYILKQSGGKVSLEESFSFYCKFPSGATVSSLCLDRYVTNNRPMACVGS